MNVRGRWTLRLLALGLGCVFGVVFSETALRVFGFSHPTFVMTDPVTGVAHIPGEEGLQTAEGRAYVRINSAGFRDVERTLTKPASTFRIAVIGDSYVEAFQVERPDSVCLVIERALRGRFGADMAVEVLNFGVSGYGTGQEYLLVRDRVMAYAPNLVLLAFYVGNDVSDNLRELKKVPYVPYFTLREGVLTLDSSFLSSSEYKTRSAWYSRTFVATKRYSRLLQFVDQVRRQWSRRQRRREAAPRGSEEDRRLFEEPPTGHMLRAWEVTETLLIATRDLVEARGARFAVFTIGAGSQVTADTASRDRFKLRHGLADLLYPQRRLRELGDRAGFPILNLAPEFLRVATDDGIYFHGFGESLGHGHWNQRGHEMAGRLIADWLCSETPGCGAVAIDLDRN